MSRRLIAIALSISFLLAGASAGADPASTSDQLDAVDLFTDITPQAAPMQPPRRAVARSRPVRFNPGELRDLTPTAERPLALPLFDDARFTADPVALRHNDQNAFIWRGRLRGLERSDVLIAVRDGDAFGEIRDLDNNRVYELRHSRDDLYFIAELDSFAFDPCGVGPEHAIHDPEHADARENLPTAPRGDDDVVTLDILVLYTPLAAAQGNIAPLIDAAVESANSAFADSFTGVQIRLVHAAEVDYTESGSTGTDLSRLRDTSTAFMPEAHALRDQYGADLVCLLVAEGGCGVGYVMSTPSPAFQANAFSVVRRDCAVGNRSFVHELGHNLGCAHDRDNAGVVGAFSYSWGYRTTDEFYRTVMAYSPGVRRGVFSNPNIGEPPRHLGIPVGEPGEAHNALGISQVRHIAADWRESVVQSTCPGDLNNDGVVDAFDLATLLNQWGPAGEDSPDYNEDGVVDAFDLAALLFSWGPCGS